MRRVGKPTLLSIKDGLKMYVEVVIFRNHHRLDRFYTYKVETELESKVTRGARVLVPFGHQGFLEGIVMRVFDETESLDFEVKSILYVFDDDIYLTENDLKVVDFIKDAYLCSYYEAIQLFMPSGTIVDQQKWYRLSPKALEHKSKDALYDEKMMADLGKQALNVLSQIDSFEAIEESKIEGSRVSKYLKTLVDQGWIELFYQFKQIVKDRYKYEYQVMTNVEAYRETIPKRYVAKIRACDYLIKHPHGDVDELKKVAKLPKSIVDKFESDAIIKITQTEDLRIPTFISSESGTAMTQLNPLQEEIYTAILEDDQREHLIYGVTGSGKTEIYAQLMQSVIDQGKKVIFVLPEISLTPQMVARFVKKFGKERIALLHSKISQGERHDQWRAIRRGEYDIIIGARSAIFAPTDDIGLIVIDEEHEHSYRSDKRPKYDTYEIARERAKACGAKIVAGSATPSIEAFYDCQMKVRKRHDLKTRFNQKPLPTYHLVDMREELKSGNKSILSRALYEGISERLARQEQVIIFLNRTGHSTFVTCRTCGFTLECPNCDVTLTYHKHDNKVSCHYCGYQSFVPKKCPECDSQYFKYFGVGTEKVEEQFKKLFPSARVARMDRTTTRKKGQVESIIQDFEKEETDILIGTQMVTKGFDFHNVTLVGILSSDLLVNMPFYYAGERAYQLINQVAGRAGRGEKEGEVIVQSYNPDHYALQNVDYETFYEAELAYRQPLNYPPFARLVNIVLSSSKAETSADFAKKSFQYLKHQILKKDLQNKVEIYPPNAASLKKLDGLYRWQILMKCDVAAIDDLRLYIRKLQERFDTAEDCQINIDLNARNVL